MKIVVWLALLPLKMGGALVLLLLAVIAGAFLFDEVHNSLYEWGLIVERKLAFATIVQPPLRIALLKPRSHKILVINTVTGHRSSATALHDTLHSHGANLYLGADGSIMIANSLAGTIFNSKSSVWSKLDYFRSYDYTRFQRTRAAGAIYDLGPNPAFARVCDEKPDKCMFGGYRHSIYFGDFYYIGGWDWLNADEKPDRSDRTEWRFVPADKLPEYLRDHGG